MRGPLGTIIPAYRRRRAAGSTPAPVLPAPLADAYEVFYKIDSTYVDGVWTGVNGTTLYQSTPGARPTIVDGTGMAGYDGGDRLINVAGDPFIDGLAGADDLTFAITFTVANQDASQGLFEAYRSSADPTLEYIFLRAIDAGLDGYLTAFEKRSVQIFARYTTGVANDTVYLAVVRCKRNGKLTLNRNGTAETESSGTNANTAHGTFTNFRLGYSGDGTGTGTYLIGRIGALVAWTRELADAEIVTLRAAISDDIDYGTPGVTL